MLISHGRDVSADRPPHLSPPRVRGCSVSLAGVLGWGEGSVERSVDDL